MPVEKILIVTADPIGRVCLETQARQLNCAVQTASDWPAAQDLLHCGRFELGCCEVGLDGLRTEELLRQWQEVLRSPPLILLADPAAARSASRFLGGGVIDLLVKPLTPVQIEVALRRAENHLRLVVVNQRLTADCGLESPATLLGSSLAVERVRQLIRKVARTDATVLLCGEPGTGKDGVARQIHRQSARAAAPWLACDCTALSAPQLEAEVFGELLSRPDGRLVRREGLLELADGGLLLLEGIGTLPDSCQARLLDFLQSQRVGPAASNPERRLDVRLVVTTHRRLEALVEQGTFREELYFRLNLAPIQLPALRARAEDVPVLAEHLRQRYARKLGREVLAISTGGLRALQHYSWPGNVRELERTVEQAVLRCPEGSVLEAEHFGLAPEAGEPSGTRAGPAARPSLETLDQLEKKHIFLALDHCSNNRTQAARLLGISIRTLRNRLREYHIPDPTQGNGASPMTSADIHS